MDLCQDCSNYSHGAKNSKISAQKHILCNEYPQSIFEQKYEKYQNFLFENYFPFFLVKFSIYLNRHVFIMAADVKVAIYSLWNITCCI